MKILIADDDPISRRLLEVCLRDAGYEVTVAVDGAEALRIIEQPDSPRLLVLDRVMPQMDGVDVCRAVRRGGPEPYVYIILLTGRSEQEEIVEGFDAGADDYVTKPFDIQELKARVRTGARIVERQEQLISAREQLRVEGMYDTLTGLLNRAAFFDIFKKDVARAERQKTPLTLIMADLDHFKDTNDRYGHLAGDAVLGEAARRLRAGLRVSDAIGRYGGEEFVIVAPGCHVAAAAALAERFRLSICTNPVDVASDSIPVTMSFGVATTTDMTKSNQLLRAADEALDRAKKGGRNAVESVEVAS